MANLNKTCVICGNKYSYCPVCSKDADKPSWMRLFDESNCNEIYAICTGFRDNVISENEAKERLEKCDLSRLKNFNKGTQDMIAKIKGGSHKKAETKTEVKSDVKSEEVKIETKSEVNVKVKENKEVKKINEVKENTNEKEFKEKKIFKKENI